MTIHKTIRSLRENMGLTQEDFSKLAGITRITVSKFENGKTNISVNVLLKMLKILNKKLDLIDR